MERGDLGGVCGRGWRPGSAFSLLEGFGAGPAYTKGQLRLFAGGLTSQVQISFGNLPRSGAKRT